MAQRAGLGAQHQLFKQAPLLGQALLEPQRRRGRDRIDAGDRGGEVRECGPGRVAGELRERLEVGFPDRAVPRARMRARPRAGACREIHGRCQQVAVRQAIDQRRLREHRRRDGLAAQDHVQRGLDANQPREPLRPAGSRQETELDLGQAELRVLVHHTVMATERELETAAKREPRHGRHDRLRRRLERRDHVAQVRGGLHRRRTEFLDVGARRERRIAADQHDRPRRRIRERAIEALDQLPAQCVTQAVDRRVREGEDRDPVTQRVFDVFHVTLLGCWMAGVGEDDGGIARDDRFGNTRCQPLEDEPGDFAQRLVGLGHECEERRDVRQASPYLDPGIDTGCHRSVLRAHRIIEQHFRGPRVEEQGRQPLPLAEER